MSARVEGDSQINPLNGNTEQTVSQKDVQNNGRAIKYHSKISGGKQFGYILAAIFSFGLALISKGCRQGCNGSKVSKFEISETNFKTKGKLEGMKLSELKQLAVAVFKKESKQDPAYQAPSLKDIEYETLVNTLTIALQHIRERKAEEGKASNTSENKSFDELYNELSRRVGCDDQPVEESEEDHSISEDDVAISEDDVDFDANELENNGGLTIEELKASLEKAALEALKKMKIAPKDFKEKFENNHELTLKFLNKVRRRMDVLPPELAQTRIEEWATEDVQDMIERLEELIERLEELDLTKSSQSSD